MRVRILDRELVAASPDRFRVMPTADAPDAHAAAPDAPAVHVRFAPSQGRRLERPEPDTCGDGQPLWEERPLLMQRADGTYELMGTSRNLAGLARWLLSFGPDAEVQGPDALRRRVAEEARRVWNAYDSE